MRKKLRLNKETLVDLGLRAAEGGRPPATNANCSGSCQESCLGNATCQAGFCYTQGCPFTFPCGGEP